MKTDLAWRNLMHARGRTLAATAGVAFAAVLIFMQIGFYRALETSATLVFDALEFDLCLHSPDYLRLANPGTFPRQRLYQARSLGEIIGVQPLRVGLRYWRNPDTGEKHPLLVLGVARDGITFRDPKIQQLIADRLRLPHHVLIDQMTRPEFGPRNGKKFGDADIGIPHRYEVAGQEVEITGYYQLGAGFLANGSIIVAEESFLQMSPGFPSDQIELGLLSVRKGVNLDQVRDMLASILPPDVIVLTRQEILDRERDFWVRQTSYGLVFQAGIAIALFVGATIVYQILSSDVNAYLAEYATLMAIGYSSAQLAVIVVRQGCWLAVFGYVPGIILSAILYRVTQTGAQVPMELSISDAAKVLALLVAVCIGSGLGAAVRLRRADPASLY
jgi:putative ABC transport system permease protein